MKATTTVFLSFLLFTVCTNSFSRLAAAEELDVMLDTDGKELQAGLEYNILPVILGFGGGLSLSGCGNETCPLSVLQEQHEVERSHPVPFTPAATESKGLIRVSTGLNIRFSPFIICIESNLWNLGYDESIGKYIIYPKGVAGNPGLETISNWFKIEKEEDEESIRNTVKMEWDKLYLVRNL